MKQSVKLSLTFAAMATALLGASAPLFARGGAANLMNSPGYQRRLQESRQPSSAPDLQPAAVHHGHKSSRHHPH